MKNAAGLAGTVALVRAVHFGANPETLASNAFQSAVTEPEAATRALKEQAALAAALESAGVNVLWLEPPAGSRSPDGVFPNNWFSTHEDGRLVIYPMEAPSRRSERIPDLALQMRARGFVVSNVIDLGSRVTQNRFLEGTGSLVLDRKRRVAFACLSSRTNDALAAEWARDFDYVLHLFAAQDAACRPVYHTNVIMSLGAGLAIVCLEAVRDTDERTRLRVRLEGAGLEIVEIDWAQVRAFAGNQLFLQGREGPVVALSATADNALREEQKAAIDRHALRVVADIATIERHGGGSVRCMLAEIFLPRA